MRTLRAQPAALLALALASLGAALLALSGLQRVDEYYSARGFAERLIGKDRRLAPQERVYSVGQFDDSLSYYLGSDMTLVAYRGELGPGIDADPRQYIGSLAEFARRWTGEKNALAVMSPGLYRELEKRGLPMHLVLADGRRVLVSRSGTRLDGLPKRRGRLVALALKLSGNLRE
jgi:predicted transcriptional regulator with HTH domain